MSDDLFQIEETLSPRLAWMKRHGIKTSHVPVSSDTEDELSGEEVLPWMAYTGVAYSLSPKHAFGETEEGALINLAIRFHIPHWNDTANPYS
jgi:hypothetical protein